LLIVGVAAILGVRVVTATGLPPRAFGGSTPAAFQFNTHEDSMNLKLRLISAAAIATCSMASQAQLVTSACSAAITDAAAAEALVANCAPVATVFIGGASTQSSNTLTVLNASLFNTALMTPIEIVDNASPTKANIKAYIGRTKAITNGYPAGSLIYAVYNYNNGSAGGVSQVLAKTPKLTDQSNPAKAIPEATVAFVGPAKNINTPGGTVKNAFCGTAATGVTSTATKVACNSITTMTADLALSDVRAQESYTLYPAATLKPSTLTQVPLFVQSFGVAVSQPLYIALQKKNGLDTTVCGVSPGIDTAACQPSISRADYASLISVDGKIDSLAALTGDSTLTDELKLARRDDLSGTQSVSNMFFANGQCNGNNEVTVPKSIDMAVAKAGGLMGGLAIRTNIEDDVTGVLDVQSNSTSTDVRAAVGSTTLYAIGVAGTGSGGKQGTAGRFVKIDGVSPNFDGTNYMNATATRNQINNGYQFSYVMFGMYQTAMKDAAKKATVLALLEGFKSSAVTNLSGIAYLDSDASNAIADRQAKYSRLDTSGKANNCSPLTKL
jgi:hypothetical protein